MGSFMVLPQVCLVFRTLVHSQLSFNYWHLFLLAAFLISVRFLIQAVIQWQIQKILVK